jgi:hypothetical protein
VAAVTCITLIFAAVPFKEHTQLPVGHGGHLALLIGYGKFRPRIEGMTEFRFQQVDSNILRS